MKEVKEVISACALRS